MKRLAAIFVAAATRKSGYIIGALITYAVLKVFQ